MTSIQSDKDFKTALERLSLPQQRQLGKRFVESVGELAGNPRIGKVIAIAANPEATSAELAEAFNAAKSAAIESYTLCGRDADWLQQASHFVAAAAAACLTPSEQAGQSNDLAWNTAMNARMAAMCANIARGAQDDHAEAENQYRMLDEFLGES
ncbi:MAG: hypothetical protein J5I92_13865 [Thiogranum sp.]|nr:hypothetical protein [Thiogranum sp.]